jgi:tetratricopeptide (TPR) repeat protein
MLAGRFVIALLLVPGLCPTRSAGAQAADTGHDPIAQANAALEARRFREALRLFDQAVAERPDSAEALYGLGRASWGADRLYPISTRRAIEAFSKARALVQGKDPAFETKVLEALVVVHLRSERVSEAREIYVTLIERETRPERIAYMKTQIGEIDLDLGLVQADALTIVNAQGDILGPIGPNEMRTNRYFEKGRHTLDPEQQEKWYRLAAIADPTMYQAHNNLGAALAQQGKYEEALLHLRRADVVWKMSYPRYPLYLRAHAWLLFCHLELGQLNEARFEGEVISEIPKKDEDQLAWLFSARLAIALGRASQVLAPLEQAVREDPEHVEFLHALASAYAGLGRFADAARTLREALAAIPNECPYFRARAPRWRRDLESWTRDASGPEGRTR